VSTEDVSFVVPVRNAEPWLPAVLDAILLEPAPGQVEVVVVEDGSTDGTRQLLEAYRGDPRVRLVDGPCRGAAAAVNAGIRAARFPLIAQVDQDVVIDRGWLRHLTSAIADPTVGAVQGYYRTDRSSSITSRVMALDLEQRYATLDNLSQDAATVSLRATDHACTGNVVYRAATLREIGGFDESLGYGYDNDVSYRLAARGYRLLVNTAATSRHHWREGLWPFLRQQYGFGYGRLDLLTRHPGRAGGDTVSPSAMMLHPVLMLAALGLAIVAIVSGSVTALMCGGVVAAGLVFERTVAGVRAASAFGDPAGLAFPLFHLGRDCAWVVAMFVWTARRLTGRPIVPGDSMAARAGGAS
jgi:GT2 family glycosyltransferase